MLDEPVRKVMHRRKFLKAAPNVRVSTAAQRMAAKNVGAILVVEEGRLAGIVTERDVVFRVVAKGLDARTTRLAEIMTKEPKTMPPEKPFGYALVLMHRGGFRHVPVVEDGKPIGIVSSRSALDPDLEEFASEASRRNHFSKMG